MNEPTTALYCPICHQSNITIWSKAKDYEYFSTDREYIYYFCCDCFTIFLLNPPIDQLKTIYPDNYYSFVSPSRNPVSKIKEWLDKIFFRKLVNRIPGEKLNVLDVGGGTGWVLDQLKKNNSRISFTQVVDISKNASLLAEEKGHKYFQGTVEQFTTEKKFHLILLLNLIEHVAEPKKVLEKAEQLLDPNGVILIKTPNTRSWDARLFRKTYWGGLHCPRHWIIFSEKSIWMLLQKTGLRIRELMYTQAAPFWSFSIIVALHKKKFLEVSAKRPIIFHPLFPILSAFFAVFDFLRRPFTKTSQLFIVLTKKKKSSLLHNLSGN